jgi:hypothetical protein
MFLQWAPGRGTGLVSARLNVHALEWVSSIRAPRAARSGS